MKQKIHWTGLGIVFGGALGSLVSIIFMPDYFILSMLGGVVIGLILGSVIDLHTRGGEKDDD